jgi:hypothetical protein
MKTNEEIDHFSTEPAGNKHPPNCKQTFENMPSYDATGLKTNICQHLLLSLNKHYPISAFFIVALGGGTSWHL